MTNDRQVESLRSRWIFSAYNLLLILAVPLVLAIVALRWRKRVLANGLDRWHERWGHFSAEQLARFHAPGPRWWWVHAVSLGEVKAIETFLRRAPGSANVRVVLSVVTPEALAWATSRGVAHEVIAAPFDLPWVVRRVFQTIQPSIFVSVESEFWPNLLREARRSHARVALINGRISHRSYRRYVQFRSIVSVLWPLLDLVSVRETQDAQRFEALGVPLAKLKTSGHLKYDLWIGDATAPSIASRPLVVMGSTREGEEQELLPALERVRHERPQVQILWAPRHIERVGEVEALLASRHLPSQRKSGFPGGMADRAHASASHLLWDSMGDLLDAYRQSDVAVIGGSFVKKGGQNPIEPAALKKPVLFGPSMDNFKEIAQHLLDEGGAEEVTAETLDRRLLALLNDPRARLAMGERAQRAIQAEQGASDRTILLLKALESSPPHVVDA